MAYVYMDLADDSWGTDSEDHATTKYRFVHCEGGGGFKIQILPI